MTIGSEGAAKVQVDLDNSHLIATRGKDSRSGESACSRHCARKKRVFACHGDAAKDAPAGSVRNHRANSTISCGLDRTRKPPFERISVPESGNYITAPIYQAVRTHCRQVGEVDWLGCCSLRNAHHAADESNSNLPTNQEPSSHPVTIRTYKA